MSRNPTYLSSLALLCMGILLFNEHAYLVFVCALIFVLLFIVSVIHSLVLRSKNLKKVSSSLNFKLKESHEFWKIALVFQIIFLIYSVKTYINEFLSLIGKSNLNLLYNYISFTTIENKLIFLVIFILILIFIGCTIFDFIHLTEVFEEGILFRDGILVNWNDIIECSYRDSFYSNSQVLFITHMADYKITEEIILSRKDFTKFKNEFLNRTNLEITHCKY
ncbi:hypothetical protein CHL78_006650 [Romboutsia weinsteinii]|uniref:Uncharacterized protein n=1 Tax=Romboutsia weinsteinii TaxID=2020949 RepID=A0A371J5M3_9FIRM|nr:hypothetical protein [Romboutsia weinsteinii]RDY27977.1 hypothetical protein CHL78_006650 [Romboutsia weinsteinii]